MATKAQLEKRIDRLEAALAAALDQNEKLMTALATARVAIAERDARIASLEERLAGLEARLNTSSNNSHLPPSKNPPHVKPSRNSQPTGKPPGGRPGHKPHLFAAIDPATVTRTVDCQPARRCDYCLADLTEAPLMLDAAPAVHHQFDLPPVHLRRSTFLNRAA